VGALTEAGLMRIAEGRSAFNRGEYFRAHELWEEMWKELGGEDRTLRILVQGLIQIAAGLHHLQQRRPGPGAGLLRKGLDKISRGTVAPPLDLRVDALAGQVAQLLAALQAPGAKVPEPRPFEL
jgi:hypothetical protein